jgi:hypothetical protein
LVLARNRLSAGLREQKSRRKENKRVREETESYFPWPFSLVYAKYQVKLGVIVSGGKIWMFRGCSVRPL